MLDVSLMLCVRLTCWHWALTGVSSPAFGTDTRKLVHLIYARPTVQAGRGCTLIDVWRKYAEKKFCRGAVFEPIQRYYDTCNLITLKSEPLRAWHHDIWMFRWKNGEKNELMLCAANIQVDEHLDQTAFELLSQSQQAFEGGIKAGKKYCTSSFQKHLWKTSEEHEKEIWSQLNTQNIKSLK